MNAKHNILKNNFIKYTELSDEQITEIAISEKFFFDTENSPIFPKEIVEKYNLKEIEYNTLKEFNPTYKNEILTGLLKSKKITTEIYIFMLGGNNSNIVTWGNSLEEFEKLTNLIIAKRIENNIKNGERLEIFVHNLAWDFEFFKYYLKKYDYKQLKRIEELNELLFNTNDKNKKDLIKDKINSIKQYNDSLEFAFDTMENDGTFYGATLMYPKILTKKKNGIRKNKNKQDTQKTTNKIIEKRPVISFTDSMKIVPQSLKSISENFIEVDDVYIKNSDNYKYNIVRDCKNYIPSLEESFYQYCDIYLLKEWYNQFLNPMILELDLKVCSTISQLSFHSILNKTYDDNILRNKYSKDKEVIKKYKLDKVLKNGKKPVLTDRQIYEIHFGLNYIEQKPYLKEYLSLSYKGGHTLSSLNHLEKGKLYDKEIEKAKNSKNKLINIQKVKKESKISGVSMDITSSYPSQMVLKPLPYGKPIYGKGEYKNSIGKNGENYNFHFITVAFDGWFPRNMNSNFGLNLKVKNSINEHLTANDSFVSNMYQKGNRFCFDGFNKINVKNSIRLKVIEPYLKKYRYVVTLTHVEFEEWRKNFIFLNDKSSEENITFIDYVSFQSEIGHFEKGLMHFFKMKEENDKKGGNKALKEFAKLIINSFYGKHCATSTRQQKEYDFEKDIIRFKDSKEGKNITEWNDKKLFAKYYGSAVTSYGRVQLRETCRKIGSDNFIYADTDSLKFEMTKEELLKICKEQNINISTCKEEKQLGFWDFEFSFDDFKVVGLKKYMYKKSGSDEFVTKCAGLPKDVRKQIKEKEDFAINKVFVKNQKKKVIGGNIIVPIKYKLNDLLL